MTKTKAIQLLSKKFTVVENADGSLTLWYKDTGYYIDTFRVEDWRAL